MLILGFDTEQWLCKLLTLGEKLGEERVCRDPVLLLQLFCKSKLNFIHIHTYLFSLDQIKNEIWGKFLK